MTWLCLVLIGTFLSAGNSIVDKKIMNGQAIHPFACTTSFGIVGLPVAIAGVIFFPTPTWSYACMGLIAGSIFIPAAWLYYDTLSREDVSRVIPILRLTSLQTVLLGSLFLGEILTPRQWIACFFLFFSSILLSFKLKNHRITCSRVALRLLPATTLLALNGILMASVYRSTSVWVGMTWNNLGMVMSVALLNLIRVRHTARWLTMASQRTWSVLIGEQTLRFIIDGLSALALVHGVPVALTSLLNTASLAWVWLLAILFLKEHPSHSDMFVKGCGIIGISLAVYLLT